jgi:hypothetical protein
MLNKVKIGMLVGIVLSAVQFFLPDLELPDGLSEAVTVVVAFVVAFFVKETPETVANLDTD